MTTEHSGANPNFFSAAGDVVGRSPARSDDVLASMQEHGELPEWLRELYPFTTRTAAVGDQCISYIDEGMATLPALLLVHGSPGWSFAFRRLVPELTSHYRVIAPDMVGFGLSSKPADAGYHLLQRHIDNLTQFIDCLGLRQITLLLHGWGGPTGLGYATANADNVSRLVLANTWGFPLPHASRIELPLGVKLAEAGGLLGRVASKLGWSISSALRAGTAKPLADLIIESYKYPLQDAGARTAMCCFWRMLKRPDEATVTTLRGIELGLKKIQAPVDIVWGRQDHMLSKLPAYLLRDSLKKSREPLFVEDAGHFLSEDAPEMLVKKLLEKAEAKAAAPRLKILS